MSLSQVLEALPAFTFEERQILIRRVIELDDLPFYDADEALVQERLAAHKTDPTSSLPLETLKERLKSRVVVIAAVLHAARDEREWKRRVLTDLSR